MTKLSAGTIAWASDPTNAHYERPVVILAHKNRPYSSVECTVMCLGTGGDEYDQYTPEITDSHLSGISFSDRTYLMPWALYSIPPSAIQMERRGTLNEDGQRLVKKGLISLLNN